MLPIVSIITPSFNQASFLRRTIESVLTQDYPNIEYLVLDGGSTDGSVDILRSYGERFPWQSQRDGGQTDAINQGLRRCRGEIVAYLNSDDTLLPGAVATVVAHFQQHQEWDMLYGNARFIDADDREFGDYPTRAYRFAQLVETCFICQPAAFWRRHTMDRFGLFDDTLDCAMDYEYWLRLGHGGATIAHVPEFLACSRIHPATKTLSMRMQVFHEILEVSRRHAGDAHLEQYCAYWHYRCHERPTGWPRLLRKLPKSHRILGRLHRAWYRLSTAIR